ncbi:hypothetical protein HU200_055310 [Digitaria exilis]|uniref:Uncharacterized protein n=1 Tax=Digitaria exilis TaxID=1010633 RepID=A0A835AEA1_9POAL|nr:hypothetical protein HU200_055310 [Digitaria exilis]
MAMAHEEQRAGAPTSSPPPRLRVLDTTLVPPSPSGSPPPECSLPLTIYDTFWLPFPPVERLFLYRLTPDADVQAILSNLKLALSRAIHAFYPLAGRIRLTPGTSDRYELHYRPGDGVTFTVAEYGGGLATDDPRAIARSSRRCPRAAPPCLPCRPRSCPHTAAASPLASPYSPRSLCPGKTSSASSTPLAAEAARRGVAPPPRCTSLVSTLGFVWSCHHRATTTPGASTDGDGRTCLLFSIDHRSRMSPPLPDKYLGNCVGPALAVAPKAALAAGDLLSACAAVTAAIDEAVSGVRTASMGAWTDRLREVAAAMSMLPVAGSPRFRVYEMDLGFGRPEKVDIVSVARTGALALAESRRGDGGMEVGVPLPPDDMARFRTCFADAIAGLHARRDMS